MFTYPVRGYIIVNICSYRSTHGKGVNITISKQLTLREWRRVLGLTQSQVAEKVGVHINTWKKYERYPATIRIGTLVDICEAFGISITEVKLFDSKGVPWTEGDIKDEYREIDNQGAESDNQRPAD